MRICIQRVLRAKVVLPNELDPELRSGHELRPNHELRPVVAVPTNELRPVVAGSIEKGLLVLLGVGEGDSEKEAEYLAQKASELRIFEDDAGKMNRSLLEIGGSMLVVSQFTLYADCRKGRRPSFVEAAKPEIADKLYQVFVEAVKKRGIPVATGVFRQEMHVELINDGPVTIWIDTDV